MPDRPKLTHATLSPAYGKDYKSKADVIAAMNENDGTTDHTLHLMAETTYISSADIVAEGLHTVTYRYKDLRNVFILVYTTKTVDGVQTSAWREGR